MEGKKLRKGTNRMLAGVCSGIAEYFNIDVTIIRILFVLFGFTGTGVLAYLICAIVMPN